MEKALVTEVILAKLFSLLPIQELKICRLVCKQWNLFARTQLSKKSRVIFGVLKKEDNYHWTDSHGVESDTITIGDVHNWTKVKEFMEFLSTRNSDIAMTFRNLRMRASLIAEYAGELLLHPIIRNGITRLDIVVYPSQVDWLRRIIPELRNLKELEVNATNFERYQWVETPPPPTDFPRKFLGCCNEVPPTLTLPLKYLIDERDGSSEIGIESLIMHVPSTHFREFDLEVAKYIWTCLIGIGEDSLSSWIIQRAPKLKHLHFNNFRQQFFGAMIQRLSRDYKGRGLQSLDLTTQYAGSTTGVTPKTKELLLFFKKFCEHSLKELTLSNLTIDYKLLLSSQFFPAQTLTRLSLDIKTKLKGADFELSTNQDSYYDYTVTAKEDSSEAADFLNIFPLIPTMKVLRDLHMQIFTQIDQIPENLHLSRNKIKSSTYLLCIRTTRIFEKVDKFYLEGGYDAGVSRDGETWKTIPADLTQDLATAFPSLKFLELRDFPLNKLNKALLVIPSQLEYLWIYSCPFTKFTLVDEDFLENGALIRFAQLKGFGCVGSHRLVCNVTNMLIYEGFLKLPMLSSLLFNRKNDGTPDVGPYFGKDALEALALKPCTFLH